MDAASALRLLSTSMPLDVVSNSQLAARVQAVAHGVAPLREIPVMHGRRHVLLADTLRLLSIATAPLYSGSILEAYLAWAQLRYLGAFGPGASGQVELSAAAKAVVGNQRRVQSEELGIGFAVQLGLDYLTLGSGWIPSVTDVDVALTQRSIQAARGRFAVSSTTAQRPDYILQAYHPATQEHRLMLLECKGTKDPRHSIRQLAHAGAQLSGLTVGQDVPPGLAISSVLSDGRTWANVLRTPQSRAPRYWTSKQPSPLRSAMDLDALGEGPEILLEDNPDVSASDLARVATRDGWAGLALYAGNEEGYEQWAPTTARVKREREVQRSARELSVEDLPSGGRATGERMTLQTPFGTVQAFRGLTNPVFEALSGSDPRRVVDAQRQSASRSTTIEDPESPTVISHGADGSVLTLSLR